MFKRLLLTLSGLLCFMIWNSSATVSVNAGKLLITEVAMKEENDWIELYVVDGSVDWAGYRLRIGSQYFEKGIPAGWSLSAGDYIVFHSQAGTDDVNKSDNNPNYWDIYGIGNLTNTDKVLQIIEPSGSAKRVDCMIYSNNSGSMTGASEANKVVADNMWDDYDFSTGDAGAWTDSDDLSAGQSISRYMNGAHTGYIDNNLKSDWYKSTASSQGGENDSSLPVFLNAFSATVTQSGILLRWQTESEVNNAGFYVCRCNKPDGDFKRISPFIQGAGNTNRMQNYEFTDHNVLAGNKYYYLIEDVDMNGGVTKHTTISITFQTENKQPDSPETFEISPSYPNPFGAATGSLTTSIKLTIPKEAAGNPVFISIYNLLGQKILRVSENNFQPGRVIFDWNGRNDLGSQVGSGIYFWVIQSEKIYEVRRVTFVQ